MFDESEDECDNALCEELLKKNKAMKEERQEIIKEFAEELVALFRNVTTTEENRFLEFFGEKKENVKLLVQEFAPFKRNQAIYALNNFIKSNCKKTVLENYDGDKIPPIYESIEIKRKDFQMMIAVGYYFFEWKNVKFIIDLYFQGTARFYRIWFRNEDEKTAIELQKALTDYLKDCNFLKGEKLLFLAQGNTEFLEYPNLNWNDVILSEDIKEEFCLNIIFPLENEKSCKDGGVPWRRGLMLGGKAGTGKTQVCRVLCNELPKGVTVIWATPKAIYNETQIQLLFEAARFFNPSLIIIEDIDFIGLDRSISQNPILGELLTQLDGNDPNDGIFVIATTNRPEMLDEALANRPSRFDVQLLFELPNPEQRTKIIALFTKKMEFAEELNMSQIISNTDGLSGSHIKEIFVHCQLKALKEKRKVSTKDIIDKAIKYCKSLKKSGKDMVR